MPTARSSLGVATGNGQLYAVGGSNKDHLVLDTVEMYNPVTDTWATVTPMPTARAGLAVAHHHYLGLYAVGGHDAQGQPLDVVEVLQTPVAWPSLPSPPPASPSSQSTTVIIGAAAGGGALLVSLAAAFYIKRRRQVYRQQVARLTMARATASPSPASV